MTLTAIFLGVCLFLLAFAVHVAWWRLARPHDDFRGLAICFFLLPGVLAAAGAMGVGGVALEMREWIAALLTDIAISATYIMYYPAAQAASPTMLLVLEIARASGGGATRATIRGAFDSELLCRQGIENLVLERFAEERDGKLHVAPRGAFLIKMLDNWRSILGLTHGRG